MCASAMPQQASDRIATAAATRVSMNKPRVESVIHATLAWRELARLTGRKEESGGSGTLDVARDDRQEVVQSMDNPLPRSYGYF